MTTVLNVTGLGFSTSYIGSMFIHTKNPCPLSILLEECRQEMALTIYPPLTEVSFMVYNPRMGLAYLLIKIGEGIDYRDDPGIIEMMAISITRYLIEY